MWQNKGGLQLFNSLPHHGITHRTDQKKKPAQKTQHEMPLDTTQHQTATAETEQRKMRGEKKA